MTPKHLPGPPMTLSNMRELRTMRAPMLGQTNRRAFIAALACPAVWPLAVRAQQGERMRRVGVLMNGNENDPLYRGYIAAFLQALGQMGWRDGQNLRIDLRWPSGDAEHVGAYAAELVGMIPDLILCSSSANLRALLRATRTTKIVFVLVSDPVSQGFVSNLAHPGGNITGFSAFEPSMASKWLELLMQVSPSLTRVAVVFNPDTSPQSQLFVPVIKASSSSFGVEVIATPVHDVSDLEPLIASFSRQPQSGLIFPSDQSTSSHKDLVLELVTRYRLPAIYASETFARNGGLISYGFDQKKQFREAAIYVDRILKGDSPGDMPIQQPTKFPLIINLSVARALGIELPTGLLLSADELIE